MEIPTHVSDDAQKKGVSKVLYTKRVNQVVAVSEPNRKVVKGEKRFGGVI